MTNDPIYTRLRELSWRRKLSAREESELRAWLQGHPGAQSQWETEAELNQLLEALHDVPVATNFTARVIKTVEQESAADERARRIKWLDWRGWRRWLPRAAVASVVLAAGLLSYHQVSERQMLTARAKELALSVATVSDVRSLPSPEILKDFEAIRALNQTP